MLTRQFTASYKDHLMIREYRIGCCNRPNRIRRIYLTELHRQSGHDREMTVPNSFHCHESLILLLLSVPLYRTIESPFFRQNDQLLWSSPALKCIEDRVRSVFCGPGPSDRSVSTRDAKRAAINAAHHFFIFKGSYIQNVNKPQAGTSGFAH